MAGYLIAFAGKPTSPDTFLATICSLAKADGVEIQGGILTTGPDCHNLAVLLEGENDRFADALTLALMPAKWCRTTDPRLVKGEFITEL